VNTKVKEYFCLTCLIATLGATLLHLCYFMHATCFFHLIAREPRTNMTSCIQKNRSCIVIDSRFIATFKCASCQGTRESWIQRSILAALQHRMGLPALSLVEKRWSQMQGPSSCVNSVLLHKSGQVIGMSQRQKSFIEHPSTSCVVSLPHRRRSNSSKRGTKGQTLSQTTILISSMLTW